MIARALAAAAALGLAVTPCLAAEIPNHEPPGARRTNAVAGAYLRVPLSRDSSGRARSAHAGFRMTMQQDYRSAQAPGGRVLEAEGLDLRLTGRTGPALYLAGAPVTGEEARKLNGLGTGETIAIVAGVVVVALVVGVLVLQDATCCE
ncbi:MAG TPA: hypothetical protein VF577_00085 [Allosphingosinicella sp.]|jgi:hypothetical protein